jgi:hypothetical protein
MSPRKLSYILLDVTKGNDVDRHFAKYYFIGEARKRFKADRFPFEEWRQVPLLGERPRQAP